MTYLRVVLCTVLLSRNRRKHVYKYMGVWILCFTATAVR